MTSSTIAMLNDELRRSNSLPCMVTPHVNALTPEAKFSLIEKVRAFDRFTPDDDPYGEHDFGAVEHLGQKWFWKIDYYAMGSNRSFGSDDPASAAETDRVLTIMHASEY